MMRFRDNSAAFLVLMCLSAIPTRGDGQIIDMHEVPNNVALGAVTETNGNLWAAGWTVDLLVDGDRGTIIHGDGAGGVTGLPEEPGFSYTVDLGSTIAMDGIGIVPRANCCPDRLRDFQVSVYSDNNGSLGAEVWSVDLFPDGEAESPITLTAADGVGTLNGRFVVVQTNQDPVDDYELQLAEIEVYAGQGTLAPINYALGAAAYTNGTIYSAGWPAAVLTNGVADVIHGDGPGGTAGIAEDEGFYYEIDLGQVVELAEVHVVPRQDGCCPDRLTNYLITVHPDENGQAGEAVWSGIYRDDFSFPDTLDADIITADGDANGSFVGQWVRITSLATQSEIDDGLVNYRLQLSEIEVYGHFDGALIGDFDGSGALDAGDINLLSQAVRDGTFNSDLDLDSDGVLTIADRGVWVNDLRRTYFGDSNLDGEFNTNDFVTVFVAGEFEDGIAGNSEWETGDWDGNGDFGTADFVSAFQTGAYEAGPRAATLSAVPEPNGLLLYALGVGIAYCCGRRQR